MSTTIVANLDSVHKPPPASADDTCDNLDPDDGVRSDDEDDDAGSLVDFIVEEDGEEGGDCDADDAKSVISEPPRTAEEERARDLDGIDSGNIVSGKRARRQTKFYEQEVFNTDEYRKMILDDVPDDERHALEDSSDEEEEGEEDDEAYEEEDESDEEEGDVEKACDDPPDASPAEKKQRV